MGIPRGLLTIVWLQEQYLLYLQVPNSDLEHHKFRLFQESLEEAAAPETPSPPHSPQGACLSPIAQASSPCSQCEDEGSSSPDKEGASNRESSEEAESSLQGALCLKKVYLVMFLLLKYCAKEPTTKAEMLSKVIKEHQDHFPEIFSAASECMQLVFGIDVKEVDPSAHTYVLVTTLGLTYDGMVGNGHRFPNTGLLVTLLWLIATEGDCASEEEVWKAMHVRGVHDGKEHWLYGEPRELLTKVWVQEKYLEYRQVPNSNPARYQFLWGPRANAETTKLKVLEFLLRVYRRDPTSNLSLSEEALSGEEEGT
ncbi:LOW QUALITY PROTEIN: melanoma-associated antigen 4-like [Myotis lucifugus]|uniref:LOW QUALITY PROTEIN: melanoma-associated antigen 4-like n=1 Tax=Myotis lucifugus TaxID=59463 RepID=UPI000CCC0606|nr:LOW QUALITY PROTEIN: melanoma-associated antigen 4-like [Myotis lucifugus]